jgi:hypothetical protein
MTRHRHERTRLGNFSSRDPGSAHRHFRHQHDALIPPDTQPKARTMARFKEPTPEQEQGWKEWVASRPDRVRAVAERFEPWTLYRLKTTGDRVTILGFSEGDPITMDVSITGEFNLIMFDRRVFGIDPNDLEPCDLPNVNEPVGAMMSAEQVDIDALRMMVHSDLWEMDDDGKTHRKH